MTLPAIFIDSGFTWADLGVILLIIVALKLVYLGLCFAFPVTLLRPLFWVLTRTVYRLRAHGRPHIPKSGPVLLVANHVSFVDWMLIWVACPRPVRFLASASHSRNRLVGLMLRAVRVISIDDLGGGPRALVKALREAAAVLDNGEVLCVFAEGQLTRNGNMLPFHRGFERIAKLTKRDDVTLIPTHLSQVWGSVFSYRNGPPLRKLPHRLPMPVAVGFGAPVPADSSAWRVRMKVQEVSAGVAIAESAGLTPPHRRFVRVAARRPFAKFCHDATPGLERELTYGRALAGAMCLHDWLRPRVEGESHVALWLPTGSAGAIANIALSLLKKVTVNLNYTAGDASVVSAAKQVGLKFVVTSHKFVGVKPCPLGDGFERIHLEDARAAITKRRQLAAFAKVLLLPGWVLDRWVLGLGGHSVDDDATIIFSSGSTAEPKGVVLTHRNIAANSESVVTAVEFTRADRLFGTLPFFHSFGYTIALWAFTQVGGTAIYFPDPRQSREVGKIAAELKPTIMISTATFLRFYTRRCDAGDFASLKLLACGAEKLPPPVADAFADKFAVRPVEAYGTTELSPAVAISIPDREVNGVRQVGTKAGSPGQPLPGIAVKAVDPDTGEDKDVDQQGLIYVKGANLMRGYWNKPELTERSVIDGWYNTGDMGYIDEDGFLFLTGRLARFAKIGGEMVPLEKVEQALHDAAGTADRVFAVTSVPCEKRGERIVVLHRPGLPEGGSAKDVCRKLRESDLPSLWHPAERDFHTVEEMPVLGSGKLDIKEVNRLARAAAG